MNFSKNYLRNTIKVSNRLDSDQARLFVGPDLGPNCLQMLLADGTNESASRTAFMNNLSTVIL